MENATKALIMAGAILIAILIISVGIIIFSSTKGVTEQQKEATELATIESYNSQFTKYCGDRVKGSTVKDLINYVATYNARNGENSAPTLSGIVSGINPASEYKVMITGRETSGDNAGKVTGISIDKAIKEK